VAWITFFFNTNKESPEILLKRAARLANRAGRDERRVLLEATNG
jgi:hypothetical protein